MCINATVVQSAEGCHRYVYSAPRELVVGYIKVSNGSSIWVLWDTEQYPSPHQASLNNSGA